MNRSGCCSSKAALLALLAAAGGCSSSQTPATRPQVVAQLPARPAPVETPAVTPDAPFRAEAPEPNPTPAFVPPHIDEFALPNRVRVLLVERHELPIVVVGYATRRGGASAPLDRPGLASFVGTMLEMGTTHRDSVRLSDDFAAIGAEHSTNVDWDSGTAFVKVLASNLTPALELLADQVQNPAFPAEEIDRARGRRLAAIQQELDSPAAIAANVAARVVYPAQHPYARTLLGTEAAVRAITRNEILAFYRSHFVPADSTLVVVGDVTRAAIEPQLVRLFGGWRVAAPAVRPVPAPPQVRGTPRIFLVDRQGAPQSSVVLAQVGVPRASPDYAPLLVMNTILGGMFSSRINMNLREAHAYTYGAGSRFVSRQGPGPFTAGGLIATRHTAAAIQELINELTRVRTSDVTEAELTLAKASLTDSLPGRFEGVEQTAAAVSGLFIYGLPLTEYDTYAARIRAVTAADVRRVAEHYLVPEQARIVVVGDRAAVAEGIEALNFGPIELRAPTGEALPAGAAGSQAAPATGAAGSASAPAPAPAAATAGGARAPAARPRRPATAPHP